MLRTVVACVLLTLVSSAFASDLRARDSYKEPRRDDRGQVIDGRYVAPGGDRNNIYNGKRVLEPGEVRQGRDATPYSMRRNEQRTSPMREYQQQRQR